MRWPICGLSLFLLALPSLAFANIAAPNIVSSEFGVIGAQLRNTFEVLDETLVIDCFEKDDVPYCEFEAKYTIRNPQESSDSFVAAFYGVRTESVQITVNGQPNSTPLDEKMTEELDEALRTLNVSANSAVTYELHDLLMGPLQRDGFTVVADGGESLVVAVRGVMRPGANHYGSYEIPVTVARHPFLGSTPTRDTQFTFEYLLSPIRSWSGNPTITLTVTHPKEWNLWLNGLPEEVKPEMVNVRTTYQASLTADQAGTLQFTADLPRVEVLNGGAQLAIGGNVDDSGGVRGRAGYQFAIPVWVLYGLFVDSDFDDELSVTPVVTVASSAVLIIPSFGLTLGVPVRIKPQVDVGVRAQVDLSFPLLGVAFTFDTYPGLKTSDPLMFQSTILATFGF